MPDLSIIVNNTTYALDDGDPFTWQQEAGTGLPDVKHLTTRGPAQHGVTYDDYRLEPRIIQEKLLITPPTWAEHWDNRQEIARIFRPSRTPSKLRWELDNGSIREILAYYNGGTGLDTIDRRGLAQPFVVEMFCPDPLFYDPNPVVETVT